MRTTHRSLKLPVWALLAIGILACFGLSIASAVTTSGPGHIRGDRDSALDAVTLDDFFAEHDQVSVYRSVHDDRISRLYGKWFSEGDTPHESAQAFVDDWAGALGARADELVLGGPFPDGHAFQPLMYDQASDSYRFSAVYYRQVRDGLPVWGTRLSLLVRNEDNHPLVWAGCDLRDLGDFRVPRGRLMLNDALAQAVAEREMGEETLISEPTLVIYAGDEFTPVRPRLALEFEATAGYQWDLETYGKRLFVIDAANGGVLYEENRILHGQSQDGMVRGMATQSSGADHCEVEEWEGMPYGEVTSGSNTAYADADGNYVIDLDGNTITSYLEGLYFNVQNQGGSDSSVTINVSGPSDGVISHNQPNTSEYYRAEVNGYLHANIVRDFTLAYNPSYPVIANQYDWPVNVNISSTCNAYYDYESINFYRAGGGCGNTAFSVVVHHEYGHHLVASAGSGQGEYGEGMGDVMGVLVTGDPELARGFYDNDCINGIRNADNNCQYSASSCSTCGSAIHSCGQLISGCVWDIRENLMVTQPDSYNDIISSLAINSMPMHNGTSINEAIAIDYLTLDDNDGNIYNGTPHFAEISGGFNVHGIDTPDLQLLSLSLPDGLPSFVDPDGGTTIAVHVENLSGTHDEGSGTIWVRTDGGFNSYTMDYAGDGLYSGTVPASECGTGVDIYFSAQTTSGVTVVLPNGAPSNHYTVLSAAGDSEVSFSDDFETDLGWSVGGSSTGSGDGRWQRGTPAGGGDRGDPPTDADGSGQCYLTGNADGNTDVDDGSTILTSPQMDASGEKVLGYWRWYDNSFGGSPYADTFVIEISDDNGSSWMNLETVGPTGSEVEGGWYYKECTLVAIAGFHPNAEFRARYTASDLGAGSVIEAAVDGITLLEIDCEGDACVGDVNADGTVDVTDLLTVIGDWGAMGGDSDVNADGVVDVADLLAVIGAWGPCS